MLHPLRVTYRGTTPSAALTELIQAEAAELERFFDHIVTCHVVVDYKRLHNGPSFRVHVEVDVPHKRLVIDSPSEGKPDATIAVTEAFHSARRIVQEYAQKLRGEVKRHAAA